MIFVKCLIFTIFACITCLEFCYMQRKYLELLKIVLSQFITTCFPHTGLTSIYIKTSNDC